MNEARKHIPLLGTADEHPQVLVVSVSPGQLHSANVLLIQRADLYRQLAEHEDLPPGNHFIHAQQDDKLRVYVCLVKLGDHSKQNFQILSFFLILLLVVIWDCSGLVLGSGLLSFVDTVPSSNAANPPQEYAPEWVHRFNRHVRAQLPIMFDANVANVA